MSIEAVESALEKARKRAQHAEARSTPEARIEAAARSRAWAAVATAEAAKDMAETLQRIEAER